jgi:lysophospholipase L1-like esterase
MLSDPNLYLIEGLDLVPNDPSYFSDGLHPNDAGHAAYATSLEALLPD